MTSRRAAFAAVGLSLGLSLVMAAACTPTVQLAAPKEPITINLNVKIDQTVRVELAEKIEKLISNNPDVF